MIAALLSLIVSLIAAEFYSWLPTLAERFLRYQAARMPRASARMLEELTAHLNQLPGGVSKMWFALDLWLHRSRLIPELPEQENETRSANVGLNGVGAASFVGTVVPSVTISIPVGRLATQGLSANVVAEVIRAHDGRHPAYTTGVAQPIQPPFPPNPSPDKTEDH